MYARFHAASRLVRALQHQQRAPACLATAWSSHSSGDALQVLQRWLHVSPTLLDDTRIDDPPSQPSKEEDTPLSREQELAMLRQELEQYVAKDRLPSFTMGKDKLPDFVKNATTKQLAKMRQMLAKADKAQRDEEFAALQRDLDLLEAQGKHFVGLERLRAESLKTKSTLELAAIRESLRVKMQTGQLSPTFRPVMEDWPFHLLLSDDEEEEGDDEEAEGDDEEEEGDDESDDSEAAKAEDEEYTSADEATDLLFDEPPPAPTKLDTHTIAVLSDAQLLQKRFKDRPTDPYDDLPSSSPEGQAHLAQYQQALLADVHVVKTSRQEDGTMVQEDMGPATARDVDVFGNPAYDGDLEEKLLRKEDADALLHDPHPFGGSRLGTEPGKEYKLISELDRKGLQGDVAAYLLRREVVVHLTHELDSKGQSDLADMITEELKDRDFEIIGRLMMQERAAEAALLMESLMAGHDLPDELQSISRVLAYDEDKERMLARRRAARLEAETSKKVIEQQIDRFGRAMGTGRRKASVAVVSVWLGSGTITINGRPLAEFFGSTVRRDEVLQPLVATETLFLVDVAVRVRGGGVKGQAQAIRHGLAVALQKFQPAFREVLRFYDLVTRDSREVERKKPGRAKARKAFQWVKR